MVQQFYIGLNKVAHSGNLNLLNWGMESTLLLPMDLVILSFMELEEDLSRLCMQHWNLLTVTTFLK